MNSIEELIEAVETNTKLVWNDPDHIEGNDYTITYIEPLELIEDFNRNTPILIQYGQGSEAQVFLHEILIK